MINRALLIISNLSNQKHNQSLAFSESDKLDPFLMIESLQNSLIVDVLPAAIQSDDAWNVDRL